MSLEINNSADRFSHLTRRHPCLSPGGHDKQGRIHLPVSPACNINCRFCKRSRDAVSDRPGVSRGILSPQEAVGVVERALILCPRITVVGIAGPGEALASDHAIETFRRVHEKFPNLIKCVSTNGLKLPHRVQELVDVGVQTLTVTVNAVDPEIQDQICGGIVLDGKTLRGKLAAAIQITAQLSGIQKAVDAGIFVKVNTVLVPGVNCDHVERIALAVKSAGASMMNLLPLIPNHEMSHLKAPDCRELNGAREAVEKHLPVFRHCKHCRADACGIPGSGVDLADVLYGQRELETFSHG